MPNEFFEDGRRIERILKEIEDTRFLIDFSSDLWANEVNIATLTVLHEKFLEFARKYELPQDEIDRITASIVQYTKTPIGTA